MASYYADDGTTGMKTKVFCNQIIIRSGQGWVLCTKNCVSGKSQRAKLRPSECCGLDKEQAPCSHITDPPTQQLNII